MVTGPSPATGTTGAVRVPHWGAGLAVLAAIALYFLLPHQLTLGPVWLIPAVEGALFVLVSLVRVYPRAREDVEVRLLVVAMVALLNAANMFSVGSLVDGLLYGGIAKGRPLLYGAASVWATNVVVYGLWFWQLDRGGPVARGTGAERAPDFQFPQMVGGSQPVLATAPWRPQFLDYLYVALTNAAAFSPTDTMPLTRTAKALMGAESLVSIVTVAIVAGRAVNILG
jgi:hypothetical protein